MPRLLMEPVKSKAHSEQKSSAGPANEGEAAKQLLEANGFEPRYKQPRNGQHECFCPFHQEPGKMGSKDKTHFYIDAKTSLYYCQSASCGESGNLQTLEKYFGVANDPTLLQAFKGKDTKLKEYQSWLTADRRQPLYDRGLSDNIIDRFRLGWSWTQPITSNTSPEDAELIKAKGGFYVIPYLENRRPVAFRYYDPTLQLGPNGSKYWWEKSSESITREDELLRLFNSIDGIGDANGRVFICEGEFKAMVLVANGQKAVSVPGVNTFKPEWAQYFMNARQAVVVMDNDNPEHMHNHRKNCHKCNTVEPEDCKGHNPGQDGAAKIVDFFGHRAKNVVLPLPHPEERKVDINEYLVRDKHTFVQFMELVDGKKASPFLVRSLAEIRKAPPKETSFLVDQLLPRGGRLLITGAPKVGKSIFAENLALSIAAGVPFLGRNQNPGFAMANDLPTPGHRVLLLDRELSARSLFDRFEHLTDRRQAYELAGDKLLVDHDFNLLLDAENAQQQLINLINANQAEVLILDTAYKFFAGDMENSSSVKKAFTTLDAAIKETGVSVVLTHHHRKASKDRGQNEAPSADQVVGSFLWTGWPNGTVLLNFKERSVANPYDVVCSFAAFRDCAPPDPLLLQRTKQSIFYEEIIPFSFDDYADDDANTTSYQKTHAPKMPLTPENVANVMLECVPVIEDEFLHMASGRFGAKPETIRIFLLDMMDNNNDFERKGTGVRGDPYTWAYRFDAVEEPFEADVASQGEQLEMGSA